MKETTYKILFSTSSHLKVVCQVGRVRNDVGIPGKEGLHVVHICLISVVNVSFPTIAIKKTRIFTGMIRTYVVYRVTEDLKEIMRKKKHEKLPDLTM